MIDSVADSAMHVSTTPREQVASPTGAGLSSLLQGLSARPDVLGSLIFLPLVFILCGLWGIRPNLDLLFTWTLPWLISLVIVVISTFILFFVVRGVQGRFREARQEKLSLKGFAINAILLLVLSWIYSHLKAGVFLGGRSYDPLFYQIDCWLFGGHEPWVMARQVLPAIAGPVLNVVYMILYPLILGSALWLSLTRQQKRSDDLICAVTLTYLVGGLCYFILPAWGPVYFNASASPAEWSSLAQSVQNRLLVATQEVLASPGDAIIKPWVYIAAFPSLHISLAVVLWWYRQENRLCQWFFGSFVFLTAISTVYLGWHYAIDWLGGLVIAVVAIAITGKVRQSIPEKAEALTNPSSH